MKQKKQTENVYLIGIKIFIKTFSDNIKETLLKGKNPPLLNNECPGFEGLLTWKKKRCTKKGKG